MQKVMLAVLALILVAPSVSAEKTQDFKVSLGKHWELLKSGNEKDLAYYTYGNKASRAVVMFNIGSNGRDWNDAAQLQLIEKARQDLLSRGHEIKKQGAYTAGRCEVMSLAYFKRDKQSTNVDYYMFCGKRLATANYAMAGIGDEHIAQAESIQKSFKLR